MTIYATRFVYETGEILGCSVDSGFKSLDDVVGAMTEKHVRRSARQITYDVNKIERVIFSDFPFCLENEGKL